MDKKKAVSELGRCIASELDRRKAEFSSHTLGAVAVDAHPWHKTIVLSVLIESDEYRKWDIGDWEHCEFSDPDWLADAHAVASMYDSDDPDDFFDMCAQALVCEDVKGALSNYKHATDFELFVGNPDDPNDTNVCETYLGVDTSKRRKRIEIVDDLDEGCKDPEAVVSVKYWYNDTLDPDYESKIASFVNLEELHLDSNDLTILPSCFSGLSHLKVLGLGGNSLTSLNGIERVAGSLAELHLGCNGVFTQEMDDSIATLKQLRTLNLPSCGLRSVPECLRRLTQLEELSLANNELPDIPEWLFSNENLKLLVLQGSVDEQTMRALTERHPDIEMLSRC